MELRKLSLYFACLVIVGVISASVTSAHNIERREANPDEDYQEGLQSDAGGNDELQNDGDQDENEQQVLATITNLPKVFTIPLGASVKLPCDITPSPKIEKAISFDWVKDIDSTSSTNLFLGTVKQAAPSRMYIDPETETHLEIVEVQSTDAGKYKCHILQKGDQVQSVEHTLKVVYEAKIIDMSVSERGLVKEGSDVLITCSVSGSPPPKLIWSREGKHGDNYKLTEQDAIFTPNSVTIRNIQVGQSGKYMCFADNGIGKPQVQHVDVKVMGTPRVHVHKTVVNSDIGVEAILECTGHEEPEPIMRWYKDGEEIAAGYKDTYTVKTSRSHTTLTIIPRNEQDFGTFTCEAENQYGKHNRSIDLVQTPVIDELNVDRQKISWKVHSHQPLEEITLQLRQKGDGASEPKIITVPIPEKPNKDYEIIYTLDEANIEPGKYEAFVSVRNNVNWATHNQPVLVEIENAAPLIQTASVLGTGGSDAVQPAFFLTTLAMCLLARIL